MIFMYVVFWLLITVFMIRNFKMTLGQADIGEYDENGNIDQENTEVKYYLNDNSYLILLLILAWTGLSFWWIGRESVAYLFYY